MNPNVFRTVSFVAAYLSIILQCLALLGVFPIDEHTFGRQVFSTVEMLLIAVLIANSFFIWRWIKNTQSNAAFQQVALLSLVSLSICAIGDGINRNYPGIFYEFGNTVKHGYVVHAAFVFMFGYAIYIFAAAKVSLSLSDIRKMPTLMAGLAVLAGLGGFVLFLNIRSPDVGTYVTVVTGSYSVLIAVTSVTAIWLILSMEWRHVLVLAAGALLPGLADLIIGKYWIFSNDHYPLVAHVNWILYFSSQAIIQHLPLQFMAAKGSLVGNRPVTP